MSDAFHKPVDVNEVCKPDQNELQSRLAEQEEDILNLSRRSSVDEMVVEDVETEDLESIAQQREALKKIERLVRQETKKKVGRKLGEVTEEVSDGGSSFDIYAPQSSSPS